MDANRLGLRDPRCLDRVMGDPPGARKRKSTWTDEDYVGQVKEEGDGKFE
jgi:hypothetical protein